MVVSQFTAASETMADSTEHLRSPRRSGMLGRIRRREPSERLLFGAVYGTVLASSLAAALDQAPANPGYDALWVLISGLVAAVAHGYAHALAHHTVTGDKPLVHAARSVLTEWPLVAATLPTAGVLLVAHAGWWNPYTAVSVVLVFNAVTLFGWGIWATRASGGSWPAAWKVGCVDMLLGLAIVVANTLIK
ncbi:hypothetical protein GCM10023075_17420 [Streptosporangium album]